ncbi:MAG: hypothetical protein RLY70_979, partial [Planctomycetota bacterium]
MLLKRILVGLFVALAGLTPESVRAENINLRDVIDHEIKASWEKEKLAP